MLMNEVREKTGLTRKAIEYYEEKGFITPKREQNNYRVYSDVDVDILNKISMYRKLGCSIDEIKDILHGNSNSSLAIIIRDREIKSQLEKNRVETLKLLLDGANIEQVKEQLKVIDNQETIYTKLTRAFPGYFGQVFFLSYKPFLSDKLDDDKVKYYEKYIEFLDSMSDFDLGDNEKKYLEEASKEISKLDLETINQQKLEAIFNAEEWLEENREIIEDYKLFKKSDLYINNPVYRIQEKLKKHMESSGYYEKAIPLMRKFSPSYDEYYKKLIEADKKFIDKYM